MKNYDTFKRLWEKVIKLEDRVDALENKAPRMRSDPVESEDDIDDPLYFDAKNFVIEIGTASASVLQRKFKIGYARAARLLDLLEEFGVIGPADGASPRDVIM